MFFGINKNFIVMNYYFVVVILTYGAVVCRSVVVI